MRILILDQALSAQKRLTKPLDQHQTFLSELAERDGEKSLKGEKKNSAVFSRSKLKCSLTLEEVGISTALKPQW